KSDYCNHILLWLCFMFLDCCVETTMTCFKGTIVLGEDVILSCETNFSTHLCSKINWLHRRNPNSATKLVYGGNLERASRLSVSRNSLLIRNISAEDAGLYVCIQPQCPAFIYLSILSSEYLTSSICQHCQETLQLVFFSPSPPDLHGNVKLHSESEVGGLRNCDSVLTVKHTTENNRRITCKFVEDDEVKIDAVYVLDFPAMVTAVLLLMLLAVITAVLFKRRKAKVTGDQKSEAGTEFVSGELNRHNSNMSSVLQL
uniref:Ig-like domain-containing protein n=1 Tax=Oryzias latipes TaxID=8090 RepID=A0A3P9KCC4_ORYLA